jgi:hypothetical protein
LLKGEAKMRAIIIRPFGMQQKMDFDAVEDRLIGPALKRLGITDFTSIGYHGQGNVPMAMFQPLLEADLAVADVSVHNANVLYQLGIRETLRDKRTLLLCTSGHQHSVDLQNAHCFIYDRSDPAASLDNLVVALHKMMDTPDQESPKFKPLSELEAAVPSDFRAEVERAAVNQQPGAIHVVVGRTAQHRGASCRVMSAAE